MSSSVLVVLLVFLTLVSKDFLCCPSSLMASQELNQASVPTVTGGVRRRLFPVDGICVDQGRYIPCSGHFRSSRGFRFFWALLPHLCMQQLGAPSEFLLWVKNPTAEASVAAEVGVQFPAPAVS